MRFEIVQRDHGVLCQSVAFRHKGQQRFAAEGLDSQSRTSLTSRCKRPVQFPGFYAAGDDCGHVFYHMQGHVRVMVLECHHQFRENIRRDGRYRAHSHIAGNFTFELVHAAPGVAYGRQDLPRVFEQTTSSFCKHN